MSFNAITEAANRAKMQFDANGSSEENRDVLKEMAIDFFRAFFGLIEDAGGDPDIIRTWLDGVPSDLDYAFADRIERDGEQSADVAMFRPRPGLLSLIVRGASLLLWGGCAMSHTKGPWKFIDATKVAGMQFGPKCVIKAGDKQIADFSWNDNSPWFPTKDESQANARLIAAAPDLLVALYELLHAYSEPDRRLCCDGRDCGCMGSTVHQQAEHYARAAIAKAEGRS